MPEEVFETSQPTQTTESRSYDWPKIILAAVLGLGLLAASAYGGYWYGVQSSKSEVQTSKPTTTSQPTPPPGPLVEIKTKNWQIYTNREYGFEFKYPQEYILKGPLWKGTYKAPEEGGFRFADGPALYIMREAYKGVGQPPTIDLYLLSTTQSVGSFIQKHQENLEKEWEEFKVMFGGYDNSKRPEVRSVSDYQGNYIEAKKAEEAGFPNAPYQSKTRFYFKNDSMLFVLSAPHGEGPTGLTETENLISIFNTFKFLD